MNQAPTARVSVALACLSLALAAPASAADAPMVAKAGDGFLSLRLDGTTLVLAVLDAARKPVAPKQGTATMFLTYPDGHRSKVDLKLDGAEFKAAVPADAHGRARIVAKVVADGATYQASFDLDVPPRPSA